MKPTIPPPPPQCYPSCQKDRLIADKLGKHMMRSAIAFGLIWGTISGVFTMWAIADLFKR